MAVRHETELYAPLKSFLRDKAMTSKARCGPVIWLACVRVRSSR